MRNTLKLKSLTLALAALLGSTASAKEESTSPMSYYFELGTAFTPDLAEVKTDGNSLGSYIVLAATRKLNEDWSLGLESQTKFTWVAKGVYDFDVAHGFLRIPLNQKNISLIPGWKTTMTYRWTVPTTPAQHQAGGLGSLLLRPAFSTEAGAFSVLIRPQVSIALVEQGYQKYQAPGAAIAGNTLFSWAVEAIPAINVTDAMKIELYTVLSQAYKGGAPTKSGGFDNPAWGYEIIFNNPFIIGGFDSSVSVEHNTTFGEDFKIIDFKALTYNLYVSRSF